MSISAEDLEHRVAAIHLVVVELLGHVGKDNQEVLDHLDRLFSERRENVTSIRPDTLQYAAQLVAEAKRVAKTHK